MEELPESCFLPITEFFKRRLSNSSRNIVEPLEETFETIDSPDNMELYIKAGPNDGEVGDCPFAHYVRCVLHYKKLEYNVSK